MSARSKIESSAADTSPSMTRNNPLIVITAERIISAGLSAPPTGFGKSNGLIFTSEFKEILINDPPTASDKCLYSFSGSITITSVPIISERKISNFTV